MDGALGVGDAGDADVLARCRAGDDAAWAELVDRYSRYVFAIAVQAFRLPPSDAEDVFQDTFARVYERLGTLRDDESFRPWLAQLTRRLCIDRLRLTSRDAELNEETLAEEAEDELHRLEEALAVRDALETLSVDCREILDRFFTRDQSYRAIGEALELPPGTIASRISRCLGRLRKQLEGRKSVAVES
ncbi:MAG TPA: sigma-70 family RNA polymerase sigma factor [Gaiellaceae bacterium]|nr:sigma-70 family RNA polymerase sigma factor [Gaiellaceae bacterium]